MCSKKKKESHGDTVGFMLMGERLWKSYEVWTCESAITTYVRHVFILILLDVKGAFNDHTISRKER